MRISNVRAQNTAQPWQLQVLLPVLIADMLHSCHGGASQKNVGMVCGRCVHGGLPIYTSGRETLA